MTKKELTQIAITSAIAATAGALASSVVAYFVARAIEAKMGQRLEERGREAVRMLRQPGADPALGYYVGPHYRGRRW